MTSESPSFSPLAIVGIGCMFPRARDLAAYWANIKNGVDAIEEVPPTHWSVKDFHDPDPRAADRTYGTRGGFLEPVEFSPLDFGLTPNALEATDSTQLLGLLVAREALRDAGYGPDRSFDRGRVSVILGVTGTLELVIPLGARLGHPIWRRALREAGVDPAVAEDVVKRISASYVPWQEDSFPGLLGNVAAGRIANRLDLQGTNCVVDAACASSLSAVHMAGLELAAGRADMVVTGGLDTFNDVFMYMCFSKTPALSPNSDAKPFDADADGTILGEGLGVLVLKRLADAERDGDRIYAVIRGIGSSSDGRGSAIYEPTAAGQVRALERAYRNAGVTADTVELIEAHGTGTKVGDAVEIRALNEVYRAAGRRGSWCALGSVKSQIGHTKAAAGAAGLIKAALALHHKVLPPTIKVTRPAPELLSGDSPFYVIAERRPWLPAPGHPRRAGVSSFGFGGSNFHVVVEEHAAGKPVPDGDGGVQIAAFSGPEPAAIEAEIAAWPEQPSWEETRRLAARSRRAFRREERCRLVLVLEAGRSEFPAVAAGARRRLEQDADAQAWSTPEGAHFGAGPAPGKLAALFPGQGSQYVGMLRDLACEFSQMLDALATADRVVGPLNDRRLSDHIYPPSVFDREAAAANEAALRDTRVAQPALGAVSAGALAVLAHFGVRPEAAAGHSYGELTALFAAGRLDAESMLALSRLRGELMAGADDGQGGMIAVGAAAHTMEAWLREESLDLVIANKNAPEQVVLSGARGEIERAAKRLGARGIGHRVLNVSAAFHSPLVAAARVPFTAALADKPFPAASFPVFANATASVYPADAEAAREVLGRQLASPVEFVAEIENLHAAGAHTFLEIGPGRALTGLADAILADRDHCAIALDASGGRRSGILDLATALARIAALGHAVTLSAWDAEFAVPEDQAAGAKRTFSVPICGANYVKPKPAAAPEKPPAPAPAAARPQPLPAAGAPACPSAGNPGPTPPPPAPETVAPPSPAGESPRAGRAPVTSTPAGTIDIDATLRASGEYLLALTRSQEQTAELHRRFLEGQAESLRILERLVEQQNALLRGGAVTPTEARPSALTDRSRESRVSPVGIPTPAIPIPRETEVAPEVRTAPPAPVEPTAPTVEPPASAEPGQRARIESMLLEVVAEKTGYPTDMLALDMGLDADLGIDSIKRVEILSALEERLPDLPALRSERLGELHTLAQIVELLAAGAPSASAAPPAGAEPAAGPAAPAAEAPALEESGARGRIEAMLLEVVAEKTGYPTDMLALDMGLDADLGIDSIKRVEILSALEERLPELPALRSEQLGELRTLGEIVAMLAGAGNHSAPATPQVSAEEPAPEAAAPTPAALMAAPAGIETIPTEPASPIPLRRSVLAAVALDAARRRERVDLADGAEIWVTFDATRLAPILAERLGGLGYRVTPVSVYDAGELEVPERLGGLVILPPERGADPAFLRAAFRLVQRVGPALRRTGRERGAMLAAVSRLDGAFGTGALPPEVDPRGGALAGLAKTVGHEWPEVFARALDIDPALSADAAAAALSDELLRASPTEVGVGPEGRITLEAVPSETAGRGTCPVGPGDVVLVSGGGRGITAEAAVALARASRATLVLLGRTPPPEPDPDWLRPLASEAEVKRALRAQGDERLTPRRLEEQYRRVAANREIRRTLERIAATGARAVYRSVDVCDAEAVQACVAAVRREHGPVRGLVHGAGVLADRRILDKTLEQFDRVWNTKVQGLEALLAALEPERDALAVLALFSSTSGRFGRTGQVDYAMANEALNKIAQREARRRPGCRVVSLNWGPWDGGMVTPSLRGVFTAEGIGLIPAEAGAAAFLDEVCRPAGDAIEVVLMAPAPAEALAAPKPALSTGALPVAFERRVDLQTYPVLAAHVIDGKPVVPMALLVEWLAHGAMHGNPGLRFQGFDGLRVLKGMVLADDLPHKVRVLAGRAEPEANGYVVPVEVHSDVRSDRDTLHAAAEIRLAAALDPGGPASLTVAAGAFPHAAEAIYTELLFHGPELQGVEAVEQCSEEGIVVRSRTAPPPEQWIRNPLRHRWIADPLALDVSFQAIILWCLDRRGEAALPSRAGRYRQFAPAFPREPIRVVGRVTRAGTHTVNADLEYVGGDGTLIARLEDFECTLGPSLKAAFRRNRVAGEALPSRPER